MPLDSSLFNDLIEAVHRAVTSTSHRKMDGSDAREIEISHFRYIQLGWGGV